MNPAQLLREKLQLIAHPEGGYYRETYRAPALVHTEQQPSLQKSASTAIYYLLEQKNFSAFHRFKSDELWHFYAGDPLTIYEFNAQGELLKRRLGNPLLHGEQAVFQVCVTSGNWFAAQVDAPGAWSLIGCTVAPGFEFSDFELAKRAELVQLYPEHRNIIAQLTRA